MKLTVEVTWPDSIVMTSEDLSDILGEATYTPDSSMTVPVETGLAQVDRYTTGKFAGTVVSWTIT